MFVQIKSICFIYRIRILIHSILPFYIVLSVILVSRPCETKTKQREPWLGFLKRPAGRFWNTVLGLYGTVDIYEREVKNPRLKKMYSSRWMYAGTVKNMKYLGYNNSTNVNLTLQRPPPQFQWNQPDLEQEIMYERFVKLVEQAGNRTYERLKEARLRAKGNKTTLEDDQFDKFEKDPHSFNVSYIKDMLRNAWFLLPREPEYKKTKDKPWIVEPKSLDPGNPNYNPQRLKIHKNWRQIHKNQGQIWRVVKQKKERLKQKKLDSFRATRRAFKLARHSMMMWLRAPEKDYSLDEELVCERNKDKFEDWSGYKKILHEKGKERKQKRKKKKKLLEKMLKTSIPTTTKKTKKTWKGFTRRSKDPYTGTRIIGKKERIELRKERRRIRNRLKRRNKLAAAKGTTVYTKKMDSDEMKINRLIEEYKKKMSGIQKSTKNEEESEEENEQKMLKTIKYYYPKTIIRSINNLTNVTIINANEPLNSENNGNLISSINE
ncbi:uncharacterized protein LOC142318141 [Lycorma delicatula]|uniref:uncharacterized protein LOC142318141 n=1 Tax=Lycorma delicatula TaxID=130591 RepID=UPI003F517A5A